MTKSKRVITDLSERLGLEPIEKDYLKFLNTSMNLRHYQKPEELRDNWADKGVAYYLQDCLFSLYDDYHRFKARKKFSGKEGNWQDFVQEINPLIPPKEYVSEQRKGFQKNFRSNEVTK